MSQDLIWDSQHAHRKWLSFHGKDTEQYFRGGHGGIFQIFSDTIFEFLELTMKWLKLGASFKA